MKTLNVVFDDNDFNIVAGAKKAKMKELNRKTYSWQEFILDLVKN